ncbi:MAG: CarD family transcriptional regulator, partial [Bacillota bacterium]|nr:CarD family transcriptional regulator [Bacillota bacterium]
DDIMEGSNAHYLNQLLPYFYESTATLADYLPKDGILILDEANDIVRSLMEQEDEEKEIYGELLAEGEVFPGFLDNFLTYSQAKSALNDRPFISFNFIQAPTGLDIQTTLTMPIREFSFYREREERGYELRELAAKGKLVFCANDDNALEQMKAFAAAWEVTSYETCLFPLAKSLECSDISVFLLADRDFFGIVKEKPQPRKGKKANAITSFVDLREGDYVVHENHGIGQYVGMERLTVGDVTRDYLHIRYRGEDKLYIPTDQMDMLQRYIGNSDTPPRVNKLGGKEWQKTKSKARTSVREMAEDLLRLYARRSAEKGHAFSPDSPWQWEMESDFPYDETPDQLEAIADIKADMEKTKPMDRLLCGDVGYGKTEVALRAAFKAVLDGKQCAVLVPTTILVQQHENTFVQRLEKYGVTVKALSRFKSPKEINATLKELAAGKVDIIIGTHMLLGKRVSFKDLGLLIIDEEQRFGVAHKEKIKELKKNIDVLAMSATPIPRTLHMSLLGARDISIIETPPPRRQPVQTYV